jgi:TonB family protein
MKIPASLVVLIVLGGGGQAQSLLFEKQAIELVKRTPVSTLEERMPGRPFVDWFSSTVGVEAGVVWQLSECEQLSGEREAGADIPACVEANALLSDGRKVIVRVAVGTFKKGVTGDPGFFYAIIAERDQFLSLNRLRDLPVGLRSPEKLKDRVEIIQPEPPVRATVERSPEPIANTSPPVEPPPRPLPTPGRSILRISEGSLLGTAIKKVGPVYPTAAKDVNAWGQVQVLVTIAPNGRVEEARAVSGHLLLRKAAVAAARQWVFLPTTLNREPVSSRGIISFDFPHP